jgi:CheY-like chemotaxis protein
MLKELGHKVHSASSGQKALDILREEDGIDHFVTDQLMPGMIGSELAEAVVAGLPNVPIVATGYAKLRKEAGEALPRLRSPS